MCKLIYAIKWLVAAIFLLPLLPAGWIFFGIRLVQYWLNELEVRP